MEVILLEKMSNLGNLGDQVRVKRGYGRNYLVPQGKAVPATPENIREFEARRAELERAAAEAREQAEQRSEQLSGAQITLHARTAGEGKLYGSVGPVDISEALREDGHEVERREIHLPEPIRHVGEYPVAVHLHSDVEATVYVTVIGQG